MLAFAVRYIRVVLPFQWCYVSFQRYYELCQRHGRDPLFHHRQHHSAVGCAYPSILPAGVAGLRRYAMAGVSLSFVVGLLAMLFYYKSHAWADICAHAEAQESSK